MIFTLSWERVSMMRTDYQQLLTGRDYLHWGLVSGYHRALRGQDLEVDQLTLRRLDRYFFYKGVYVDTVSGQQVRWSQVFQLEDPREEDPLCMQGTDSRGQSSGVSVGGSSTEVRMGPRDCRIEQFIDRQGRVDHFRGKLF
jgi:hypothetical protein